MDEMKATETDAKKHKLRQIDKYKWSSTTVEEPDTDETAATWGIAFNFRPSPYYYRGKASWWARRAAQLAAVDAGQYPNELILSEFNGEVNGSDSETGGHNPVTSDIKYVDSESEDEKEQVTTPVRTLSDRAWLHLFATVNSSNVRIYRAQRGKSPKLLRVFTDASPDEVFYAVAFTFNADNNKQWWVLAAGVKGVIRVMSVLENRVVKTLVGHGEAVNDLKVHPRDPALIVTASKDESLRMWNLRTGAPIAMFAGLKGHRGEVLSVDFDRCGNRFASCGIDNSVRVWSITADEEVVKAILESHKAADLGDNDKYMYTENGSKQVLRVPISQFPGFVTRKVHKHYVDCVKWVGDDMILSKSVHNRVYLWELGKNRESMAVPATKYKLLEEYVVDNCNVWFVRFGLDRFQRVLACGNEKVSECFLKPCASPCG